MHLFLNICTIVLGPLSGVPRMSWTETPAEAFRKKLIADAEESARISKMIIADCERRQKEHDEWLIKKGMEENDG